MDNLSMVVISVWEILFVINLGLLVLNKVMVWKVLIMLVMVFSKFNRGVIIEMILINVRCFFSGLCLCRMVLSSLSFNDFSDRFLFFL